MTSKFKITLYLHFLIVVIFYTLDPYPDGLSNEGTVIIKGSLQVDGTTTSVNSTTSTLNDPIFHIGDLTSERTVMTTVVSGVSTIRLDSVVGINTGDIVSVESRSECRCCKYSFIV